MLKLLLCVPFTRGDSKVKISTKNSNALGPIFSLFKFYYSALLALYKFFFLRPVVSLFPPPDLTESIFLLSLSPMSDQFWLLLHLSLS